VIERTDRLNAVGLLAAGMAHEINNPLQGMLSHLRALQPYVPPDSAARRNLDMAQKGVDTIASLVRRLLMLGSATDDAGHDGADTQEAIDFVAQLLESQFRRVNVRIERNAEAQGVRVAMPRAELIQIVMNLLINARDAMPDGGTVRVRAAAEDDNTVRVVISDTGQGIAPELMGKIFAPFFTTKGSKGTGLGLSVTESLVRSRRGQISVKSEPGKGTSFDIILPRFQGERK
jgi:two-component system, NtrC family, sensor kinase